MPQEQQHLHRPLGSSTVGTQELGLEEALNQIPKMDGVVVTTNDRDGQTIAIVPRTIDANYQFVFDLRHSRPSRVHFPISYSSLESRWANIGHNSYALGWLPLPHRRCVIRSLLLQFRPSSPVLPLFNSNRRASKYAC